MATKIKINIRCHCEKRSAAKRRSNLLIALIAGLSVVGFTLSAHASYTPFNTSVNMNVGIGTATPQGAFVVTNGNVGIGTWAPGGGLVVMNGNVGIGTAIPSSPVYVNNLPSSVNTPVMSIQAPGAVYNQTVANFGGYNNIAAAVSIRADGALSSSSGYVLNGNAIYSNQGFFANDTGALGMAQILGATTARTSAYVDYSQVVSDQGGWVGTVANSSKGRLVDYIYAYNVGVSTSTPYMQVDATAGTPIVSLLSNVGIGTINSGNALAVNGGVGIGTTLTDGAYVGANAAPSGGLIVQGNVGIGTFNPFGGALIVGSGNVGIGSLAPGQLLDVQGTVRDLGEIVGAGGLTIGGTNYTTLSGIGSNFWLNTAASGNVGISTTNTVGIGTTSGVGAGLVVMNGNVGIGTWAPANSLDVVGGNIGIGTTFSLVGLGTSTPNNSTFLTLRSDPTSIYAGLKAGAATTAGTLNNTALGYLALYQSTTAHDNIAIGFKALSNITTAVTGGSSNIAIGNSALTGVSGGVSGYQNVAVGGSTLIYGNGVSDTAVGYGAGNEFPGSSNTFIGANAAVNQNVGSGGNSNVAVGYSALNHPGNGPTNNETVVGSYAGSNIGAGQNNVDVGFQAGFPLGVNGTIIGANNVFVGANSGPIGTGDYSNSIGIGSFAVVGANNVMVLGGMGTNAVNVGIGTFAPNGALIVGSGNVGIGSLVPGTALDITGTARMTGFAMTTSPSSGYVLTSDATGNGTWQAAAGGTNYWLNTAAGAGNVGISTTNTVGIGTTSAGAGAGLVVMNGNVGIGTWVPGAALIVNGNVGIGTATTSNALQINGALQTNSSINGMTINSSGTENFFIGTNVNVASQDNMFIGFATGGSISSGSHNTIVGTYAEQTNHGSNVSNSIALGFNAEFTDNNQLVIGDARNGPSTGVNDGYIGDGVTNVSANNFTLNATGGNGTNIIGGNLTLAGGKSTGNAVPGSVIFSTSSVLTSGTTLQSLTERMRVDGNTGNVGIGTTTPQTGLVSMGNVGIGTWTAAGGNLIVNGGGNVGIGSAWPGKTLDINGTARMTGFTLTGNGASSGNVLVTNAVGIGTWVPASTLATSGGASQWTTQNTTDVSLVGGNVGIGTTFTTTSALTVMNGNVGIGTWVPDKKLTLTGDMDITGNFYKTSSATTVNLSLNDNGVGSFGFPVADFTFPNGGKFASGEIGVAGTNDVFFQALPATTSGYGYLEAYNSAGLILGTGGNTSPVIFKLNRTEYMRLTAGGNLGIGTATPGSSLSVLGGSSFGAYAVNTAPAGDIIISGNVGIGTTNSSSFALNAIGVIRTGTYLSANDASQNNALSATMLGLNSNTSIQWAGSSDGFGGGKDTGITRASGGVLEINNGTGGTYRDLNLRNLYASTNIGIGSATPGQALDVHGTARMTGFALTTGSSLNGKVLTSDASGNGTWATATGGSNYWLNTAAAGNVGISTTNTVGIGTTSAGAGVGLLVMNGNVGIGTWAPTTQFSVVSPTSYITPQVIFRNGVTANIADPNGYLPTLTIQTAEVNNSRPLFFGYDNGSNGWDTYLTAGACGSYSSMCLDFGSGGGSKYTALRISSNDLWIGGGTAGLTDGSATNVLFGNTGNVGIGTMSPGNKLSVLGGVGIGSKSYAVDYTQPNGLVVQGNVGIGTWGPGSPLDIQYASASSGGYGNGSGQILNLKNTQADNTGGTFIALSNADGGNEFDVGVVGSSFGGEAALTSRGNTYMSFSTNNLERLRITSGGNVGIGTTTPVGGLAVMNGNVGIGTWVPAQALDVEGGSIIGRIKKRVTTAADATSITPNSNSADITYQLNTQSTGTLTINADGGTPTEGQTWVLKIKSTNVQTYSWNAVYASGGITLPTASSSAKTDVIGFMYDSVSNKWECMAYATY